MLICQWHLDVVFGKQGEALSIMREWGKEKFASSDFKKASGARMMVGHVGDSPSHVVDEYYFESLADFESALAGMNLPQFKKYSDALASFIVPGSQHWKVYRVI